QHPRYRNRGCFWSEPLCSQFAESSPSPSPPVVGILHRCPPLNHNGSNRMREVFPVKYYKDEGFVERKIELDDEDLDQIIEEYLRLHADFDFDEIEIVNNRPMNIWLYAKC